MKTVTVEFGGAKIQLPEQTVVENWLERLPKQNGAQINVDPVNVEMRMPRIGEFWHGLGGIYAGLVRGEDGQPDYHLIVANGEDGEIGEVTWGAAGEDEPGANHQRDGYRNTQELTEETTADHPAADWAWKLRLNGFEDWYLPSRRELALCYANVPELFAKTWYWSSTQYSADYAWGQWFDDGDQYLNHKGVQARARAVRRFVTHLTI